MKFYFEEEIITIRIIIIIEEEEDRVEIGSSGRLTTGKDSFQYIG